MDVHVNARVNELREVGDWLGVEQAARDLLNRNPDDVFALRALAQALEHQSVLEDLPGIWRKLADLEDRPGPVEKSLGAYSLREGKKDSAIRWYRRALDSFVRARDDSQVEELWLELCDLDPTDLDWFLSVSERLGGSRHKEQAALLLQLLVPYYEEHERWDDVLALLCRSAAFAPQDLSIRDGVIKALRARHAGALALEDVLDHCGLRQTGAILEGLERAERLIPFSDGEACFHPDWGVGLVTKIDLFSERVTIDFERKKHHEMTLDLAQEVLEPLPHQDIRAAWARERERVSALINDDPLEIVKMALVSCEGKAAVREIKQRLCGTVIPEKQWSRWWSNVSGLLRRDSFIGASGGAAKTYFLRDEARSAEDEWMEAFDKKRSPLEKIEVVFSYLKSSRQTDLSSDLLRRFALSLSALAAERRNPAIRTEIYFTLADIKQIESSVIDPPEDALSDVLADGSLAVNVLGELRREEHQWRLTERLRERHPETWVDICKDLILSPRSLIRNRLAGSLQSEDLHYVLEDLAKLVAPASREYPEAFVWFSEQVLLNPQETISLGIEPPVLFERLLALVDFLSDRAKRVDKNEAETLRASASTIRSLIKRDDFAILRGLLKDMDRSVALSLYKRAGGNAGLDVRAREHITRQILARFPDLLASVEVAADKPTEFLCTYPTLQARRERLRKIVEDELPRVIEETEEARKHGDLGENAEYHAARDKQRTLYAEASDIREQLNMSRMIDLSTVEADQVRFGVIVRIRTPEEEEMAYTVLGPWESDPENNIVSYQAPFIRGFIGKKIGETVQVDLSTRRGEFMILGIEPIPPDLFSIPD
ncbi:MAG: GreA/GreB family elongation factor [bacterium]